MELRQQGMSQAQAAAVVGVSQQTVDNWESGFSNANNGKAKTPDLRISVPKDRYGEIYERRQAGEPVSQIAETRPGPPCLRITIRAVYTSRLRFFVHIWDTF
ncbi:MAG TPA: helix-turn-helix transcriptional regulator [Armatimonadota bacterium]|nr:helix-turn-helix transcriptional regulator [Armatimonadota bacterium]